MVLVSMIGCGLWCHGCFLRVSGERGYDLAQYRF